MVTICQEYCYYIRSERRWFFSDDISTQEKVGTFGTLELASTHHSLTTGAPSKSDLDWSEGGRTLQRTITRVRISSLFQDVDVVFSFFSLLEGEIPDVSLHDPQVVTDFEQNRATNSRTPPVPTMNNKIVNHISTFAYYAMNMHKHGCSTTQHKAYGEEP